MLIMNRLQRGFQVCCIKAPSYGEYRKAIYRDIAMLTNGKVVSEDTGVTFDDAVPSDTNAVLGVAKMVSVTKETTTIVGCGDNKEELEKYYKEEYGYTLGKAMDTLYNSDTFARIQNVNTGLYYQSTGYVYSFLSNELTFCDYRK